MSVVSDIEIRLRADIARLQQDMDAARTAVGGAMNSIQSAVGAAKGALAAFAGALAIKAIADFAKETYDAVGALHDMSIQTGASVAALMQFKVVASTSETSIEGIATMLNKLAKNMAVSNEESKGTGAAIKALGLDFETIRKMAPDQQLLAVAKGLDKFSDGAGKSAVAMTLFGKEGAKALPFLADLADASDDVSAALTDQKVVAAAALGAMADDFGDNMTRIQRASASWKKEIALATLPAMAELAQSFLDVTTNSTGLQGEIKKLAADGSITSWAQKAVTAVSYVIDAFTFWGRVVGVITDAIGSTLGIVGSGLAAQFKALNQAAHGDFRDAWTTIKNQVSITGAVVSNFGDSVGHAFGDEMFGEKIRNRIAELQKLGAVATKESKPAVDFKDTSADDAAAKKAAAEKEAAAKKEVETYNGIIAASNARIEVARAELAAGKALTEGQKELIKFDADLKAGKIELGAADAATARANVALAATEEARAAAAMKIRDAVQAQTDAQDAAFVSLAAETLANQTAVANFGLTKAAIEANTAARLEAQAVTARAGQSSLEYVGQLEREAAAHRANAAAITALDGLNAGTDVAKAKELLDIMSALDDAAKDAASGMAASFGAVGTAIGGLTTALTGYARTQAAVAAELAASKVDAKGDPTKVAAAEAVASKKSATAQIKQYGDMAGAAKGFFKENSTGYKVLSATEKAFRAYQMAQEVETMLEKSGLLTAFTGLFVASKATQSAVESTSTGVSVANAGTQASAWGITAVVKAIASMPFPLNLAAGAATLAAVIAIGAKMMGGGGSSAPSITEQRQAANGTGTVLGDSSAKSESIANSLKLVADNTYRGLSISTGMLTSLRAIQTSLSGLGSLLAKSTGLTSALNTASDPSGGFWGGLVSSIFGGKTTVQDSGIMAAAASVSSIKSGAVNASSYVDTKTSGGWFSSDKYRTATASLGAEVNAQFTKIITGMADSITSAAGLLGMGGAAFTAKLNSFVVDLGKISLSGLSGADAQAALETAFSKLGDDMANFAVAGLAKFQAVGEGVYETLVRIANDYATVDAVLSSFGKSFGSVGMASVEARENLIALAGGLEDFISQGSYFLDNFFTDQEKAATLRTAVNARITPLNGGVDVTSIEQYKNLALAQDLTTASGQAAYTTLMATAEAFKELVGYGNAAGQTLEDIASERTDLQDQIDALTKTSMQLRAKERATLDASNQTLYDQLQALNDLAAARTAETDAMTAISTASKAAAASLTAALDSLKQGTLSTLTPLQKLADAQGKYQQSLVAAQAKPGDSTLAAAAASAATAYLTADQIIKASSSAYAADSAKVQAELAALAANATATASAADLQLAILTAQADSLLTVNDSVNAASTSIVAAIAALQLTGYMDGSHANGLTRVPFDGYRAELHAGEGVLTASQNRAYLSGQSGGSAGASSGNTDALVSEIRALRAEVAGLRKDQEQQTGYIADTVARSSAASADQITQGSKDAAMASVYADRLSPALA